MDLIVRNAKIRGRKGLWDIGVENGVFKGIEHHLAVKGNKEVDAGGHLTSPPFIDPHLHLDAVLSVGDPRYNTSGTLLEGIRIWGERKKTLTAEVIKENAVKAIKWAVANGTLKIRTHVDTTDPTLKTVQALVEVREDMKDLVDIQIVAFPQDGIYTFPDGEKLMRKAVEMGADVLGGIPHNEFTREDGVKDVEFVYDLAEKTGSLIDIHIDETGDDQSRFVEVMAKESINRGMQGLATASHTTAMHNYNNDYALKLIGILKRAEMNMITNPFDNSVLQNRTDGYPRRRGHTRVDELLARGVTVSIGHDSIMDPWYPLGKASMLSAANLLLHTAHMSGYEQFSQLFDMVTTYSATTMNVSEGYGIKEGNQADFVILDAVDEMEALRLISECLYVVRKGKILVETKPAERRLTLGQEKPEMVDFKL